MILKKRNWTVDALVKKARVKFDWQVDPLQLGSRFLQAKEVKDYPRMVEPIDHGKWQNFFVSEAKEISASIFVVK